MVQKVCLFAGASEIILLLQRCSISYELLSYIGSFLVF